MMLQKCWVLQPDYVHLPLSWKKIWMEKAERIEDEIGSVSRNRAKQICHTDRTTTTFRYSYMVLSFCKSGTYVNEAALKLFAVEIFNIIFDCRYIWKWEWQTFLKRTSALNLKVRRLIKSSWAGVGPALNSGGVLQSKLHLIMRDYPIFGVIKCSIFSKS
jgi:hypothetical protein